MQFLKLQRNNRVDSSVALVVEQEVGNPNFFTSLSRTSLVNNVISDKKEDCNNKKDFSFCLYSCFILRANYGYILI